MRVHVCICEHTPCSSPPSCLLLPYGHLLLLIQVLAQISSPQTPELSLQPSKPLHCSVTPLLYRYFLCVPIHMFSGCLLFLSINCLRAGLCLSCFLQNTQHLMQFINVFKNAFELEIVARGSWFLWATKVIPSLSASFHLWFSLTFCFCVLSCLLIKLCMNMSTAYQHLHMDVPWQFSTWHDQDGTPEWSSMNRSPPVFFYRWL